MKLSVDSNRCIHCGACVRECLCHCLVQDENGIPNIAPGKENQCIDCQHCVCVCPQAALRVNGHSLDTSGIPAIPASENLFHLIQLRRSYRHYKDENVPTEQIEQLKSMLSYVPTGVNTQKLHYTFILDKDVMKKFRSQLYDCVAHATENLAESTRGYRFKSMPELYKQGNDILFRGAPHMVVVSCPPDIPCPEADPWIALSYFELYAQCMGIATLWCGLLKWAFNDVAPESLALLNLPKGHEVKYVMLFGIPDVRYFRIPQRAPISLNEIQ